MTKRYRLGVAGLVHDHVWHELEQWAATDRVEFVAACESHAPLCERLQREYGVEHFFSDIESMLDHSRPDVIQVCTSNAAAAPIVERAAAAGIHAVVEKPMAATLDQADRMLAASRTHGTRLFINWPFRWRIPTAQAWELVRGDEIGHVFHARIRMAHKGPREFGCSQYFCDWLYDAQQNGGGALVDYCSYGAVTARYLFGRPEAIQAVAGRLTKTDIAVEDNAAVTMLYDKRHVTAEASWSQIPSYHDSVYLGTRGTLWTASGKLFLARESGEPQEIPGLQLPAGFRSGPECFLQCLERDEVFPDVCDADVCRDAQEILEAGLESARDGCRITLPR